MIHFARKKYNFNLWEHKSKLRAWQYLGIVICLLVSIASHYVDWGGFKPFLEFQALGLLKFVFQYIYYLFEAFLFSLIIVFRQKAVNHKSLFHFRMIHTIPFHIQLQII